MRIRVLLAALAAGLSACGGAEAPPESLVVIGLPASEAVEPLLAELAPEVRFETGGWTVAGKKRGSGALVACFQSGNRRVTLGVSRDERELEWLRSSLGPTGRSELELWRMGERVLHARLTRAGRLRSDTVETLDLVTGLQRFDVDDIRCLTEVPEPYVHNYLDAIDRALERASWAGIERPEGMTLVARKAVGAGGGLAHYDPASNTLTATLCGTDQNDGGRALVAALLVEELGPAGQPGLADVFALAACHWLDGRSLDDRVTTEEDDPNGNLAARAVMLAHAIDLSPDAARGWWQEPPPMIKHPIPGDFIQEREFEEGPNLWLRTMVSARPGDRGPWKREDATLEGDDALLARLWQARAEGHRVALEIELVASPSGTFDADRVLTTTEQWNEHFDAWTSAVRRVGRLAELGGAHTLLLVASTPKGCQTEWVHDEEEPEPLRALREVRRTRFAALLEDARYVFGGTITVAVDNNLRSEEFGLWNEVDAIGLRWVHAPKAPVTTERMGKQLERAITLAAGRPLILLADGLNEERSSTLQSAWQSLDPQRASLILR